MEHGFIIARSMWQQCRCGADDEEVICKANTIVSEWYYPSIDWVDLSPLSMNIEHRVPEAAEDVPTSCFA